MSALESRTGTEAFEFGPYRVDVQRQTLLRGATPIALTPKSFQLLVVLLRHGNETVTKDELMKAVWPDTFVEETNLTRNIFALRKALGETEQDRYIVTAPGVGYRFACDVRAIAPVPDAPLPAPGDEMDAVAAHGPQVPVQVGEAPVERAGWWRWLAAAAVIVLGGVALVWFLRPRRSVLAAKDTVVLADFSNTTGDQVFDDTLKQGMAVELEQSPFLKLVSEDGVQRELRLMGQPADTRLTPQLAQEICVRTGSAAVLSGSIASVGSQYVLGLHAKNCTTGEVLDDEQSPAARKEDVLGALSTIAGRFRRRAGESLATIQQHSVPLDEATTASLEALKAYSIGRKVLFTTGSKDALPHFERAVEIDPEFAMAHEYLSRVYGDTGETVLSQASARKAYELRDRAGDREKFMIASAYDSQMTGNIERAAQTFELMEATYPRDIEAPGPLSGYIYPVLGKYEQAAEQAKRAIALDPQFPFAYMTLATADHILGRFADAEEALRLAAERKIEISELLVERYDLSFLEGDKVGMARAAAAARGTPAEDWVRDHEASALAYTGRLREGTEKARQAAELARPSRQEAAALYMTGPAVWAALFGDEAEAKRNAKAALDLSRGRDVEYGAAFAYALAGEAAQAEKLAGHLEKSFPEDTSVQFNYLPVLRALIALGGGQAQKALLALEHTRYELGTPGSWNNGNFGALYPVYVRGLAYLGTHQGAKASAEFQKIIDYRGVPATDPVAALARLQMARADVLAGDRANGQLVYTEFLALWKDADRDLPLLRQAEAENQNLSF